MRDRGGGWDHKTGSQYDCVLAQQRDICEPTLQTSRKETATNRSSTTRTGTVRYGLKIISFEVTVRTDKGTDFEDAVSGLHRFVRSKTVGVVLDCTCLIEARRERQFSNYVLRIQLSPKSFHLAWQREKENRVNGNE